MQDQQPKQLEALEEEGDLKEEVHQFNTICDQCSKPSLTKMKVTQIPHFKVTILASEYTRSHHYAWSREGENQVMYRGTEAVSMQEVKEPVRALKKGKIGPEEVAGEGIPNDWVCNWL